MSELAHPEQSNTVQARKLAEEVVRRDDTTITEALLADAIGHLVDEVDALHVTIAEYRPDPRSAFIGG